MLRIIILLPADDAGQTTIKACFSLVVFTAMLCIARPYQSSILNNWEIFCYLVFTLDIIWVMIVIYIKPRSLGILYSSLLALITYLCVLYVVKILRTFSPRCYDNCANRIRQWIETYSYLYNHSFCCNHPRASMAREDVSATCVVDEDYPDRVNNPQNYGSL